MIKQFLLALLLTLAVVKGATAQAKNAPRCEVGVHFSSITVVEPSLFPDPTFGNEFRTEPGVGGRFTCNLTDSIAAEAEVNFFPNDQRSFNDYTAGRMTQGLFGIKAGRRFERFGIYGKARPGFVHFSHALNGSRPVATPTSNAFLLEFDGRTNLAVDIGGVLEFYPSRRIVTRFDIGDTIIRFRELTFGINPACPINPSSPCITSGRLPGRTTNNFQFGAGIGIRF